LKVLLLVASIVVRLLVEILSSLLNGAMLTGTVRRNCENLRYFRHPLWKTKSS